MWKWVKRNLWVDVDRYPDAAPLCVFIGGIYLAIAVCLIGLIVIGVGAYFGWFK